MKQTADTHTVHIASQVDCCRFINRLYQCWFLAGVECRTLGI